MDAADAEDFCRICFGNAEPQLRARGRLISPCACTGSVRHIHLHCLRTWQATQSMQGRVRKARACELCKCRYVVPRDVLREEAADQGRVAKLRLAIEERWSLLNSRRPRPLWLEYLLWWCQIVLVSLVGLVKRIVASGASLVLIV